MSLKPTSKESAVNKIIKAIDKLSMIDHPLRTTEIEGSGVLFITELDLEYFIIFHNPSGYHCLGVYYTRSEANDQFNDIIQRITNGDYDFIKYPVIDPDHDTGYYIHVSKSNRKGEKDGKRSCSGNQE